MDKTEQILEAVRETINEYAPVLGNEIIGGCHIELKSAISEIIGKDPWISVEDRLPENNDLVLTYSYEISGHKYRLLVPNTQIKTFPDAVTHWQPLPPLPEQEG